MGSMERYNNINQTDLTKGLITIDSELESEDIKSLKFLCQDHITLKTLEKIKDGIQLFNELERLGKIDTAHSNMDYLLECLCRCHRMDLIKKLGFDQVQVKNRVENCLSNLTSFRILLFEIAEETETTDIKTALFSLSSIIPRSKHDKIESMFDIFTHLERSGDLSPVRVTILDKLLKMLDRSDLINKVREYQGIVPTGGNTELGRGPVDEGQIPFGTEIGMGPVERRGIHVTEHQMGHVDQYRLVGTMQMSSHGQQHQNSFGNPGEVIDIRGTHGNKNGEQLTENVFMRIKIEDRVNDRIVPSHQSEEVHNSMNTEQELPSPLPYSSIRVPGNQTSDTVPRTGTSGDLPASHHLVIRNDVLEEEQSPGDSGLTAGTVSLSERNSPEMEEIKSGEVSLSLTEGKLTQLSEVIARHEDWKLLATALGVEMEKLMEIMKMNPTTMMMVHGLLRHWYFMMKNRNGISPSAEGLLDALRSIGFSDVVEEYYRLSQESEMETEAESENLVAVSEGHEGLNFEEENYNVSSGEARVAVRNERTFTDMQGPVAHGRMSSSDAQVGPSLDPLINQRNRQLPRNEDLIVRQMETVAIDDSVMPFYKMDAKPRGIAVIINNMNFYKVRGDSNSKEMPGRTGTEKDAEKLDYIWRKLGFIVRQYNDVDSTRIVQIMVETAFESHANYDCFVCCILTHGVLGHVYGTDGRIVRINQLTGCFSSRRCTTLAGKPKMFFIQACQGRDKQEGHAIETDSAVVADAGNASTTGNENRQDIATDRPRELIPDEADFLLGYATVPGYVSYRSRSQGSWYINKLAQNLDKFAYQHDLLSILIKVNEEVGRATANIDNGAYKQIPAPMFTLRKRIIFR